MPANRVAAKLLRAGRLASQADLDRFLREARSAARLKHPGIVSLYEIGQTAEGPSYLVEEFVAGTTLAARIEKERFAPRQAAELVALVAVIPSVSARPFRNCSFQFPQNFTYRNR